MTSARTRGKGQGITNSASTRPSAASRPPAREVREKIVAGRGLLTTGLGRLRVKGAVRPLGARGSSDLRYVRVVF